MSLEITFKIENVEEVKRALDRFPVMFKNEMFRGFQRIASKEEKMLKGTSGFQDRTGHLRRSLFVTAMYKPLGLEMGSTSRYAGYVAKGHGTWKGNWWNMYIKDMTPRVVEGISRVLKRLVNKWNKSFRGD